MPHDYFLTFAAIMSTGFGILFPWWLNYFIIKNLAAALIPKDDADFIVNEYLPELQPLLAEFEFSYELKKNGFRRAVGMLIKIIYAFIW